MLSIAGLAKRYGPRTVFADVALDLAPGAFLAIMGDSGVGKSTLLNLIAGLDTPDAGRIAFQGQTLDALDDDARTLLRRRHFGFVFQAFHVLPHLTVAGNVALPLQLNGIARGDRVARALEDVGLANRAGDFPRQLSGGELQRVAIARALVHGPALILADEPTGNLDPGTAAGVLEVFRRRVKATGAACLMVTHSDAAAGHADAVYRLSTDGLRPQ